MRALAQKYPRWGYRKMKHKLTITASYNRVYRVWRKSGLSLPRPRHGKRIRGQGHRWMSAIAPNGIWTYDFIFDACANGEKLKMLVVTDEYNRKCLSILVLSKIRSKQVIQELSRLFALHGPPHNLRSDNGPEFVAKSVQKWLRDSGVATAYVEPGKPWQNGLAESVNSVFRNECLDFERFANKSEAKIIIENWRLQYNYERPHGSLNYKTPAQFCTSWQKNSAHLWRNSVTFQKYEGLSL